jgi:hypothetical protein
MIKSKKIFALTLITSLLVLAAFASVFVKAQSTATLTMLDSVGGSTVPAPGTTNPADGTQQTFTATADPNFIFQYWIVSSGAAGSSLVYDNPVTLPMIGGITFTVQAVFSPLLPPPGVTNLPTNLATSAIIEVLAGAGGTTIPAPGTYALADATSLNLTAMPDSGWQFAHWVISGPNLSHGGYPFTATPTDNPYNVNHGYGNTFAYQPVFVPLESTVPTPSIPEYSSVAAIGIALALVAVAFGTIAYRRKTK